MPEVSIRTEDRWPPLGALAPNPEEADIVASLQETIDRLGKGIDPQRIDQEHRVPADLLGELAELGMMGLSLPEEHGGYGLSLWATGTAVARLAMYDRSVATTVGLHLGLGTRGLVRFGTPEQHARWLPDLAAGRKLAAFAATEPEAGSDLGALRTKVVPVFEGSDRLQVDGSKIFVTNGGLATYFTILAASPGLGGARRGQSVLMLEKDDPGMVVGAEEVKLGLRGSSTTTLSIDGVQIGYDRIIGQPGQGSQQAAHILAWGRTAMAAGCCGTGRAAIDAAVKHTAQREQFGRPLKDLPVVAAQLDLAEAQLFAMEATVRWASWDPATLETRSLAAKVFNSEGSWELADLSVQLHGGSGFIEETGVALILRDARITRIFEGANDVLRIHMGLLQAMDLPRASLAGRSMLGARADELALALQSRAHRLKERLGARLGGAHTLLHLLGSVAVLTASCDAAVLRAAHQASAIAQTRAERWVTEAHRRALPLLAALDDGLAQLPERHKRSSNPSVSSAGEVST